MTDSELLVYAAKAAGLKITSILTNEDGFAYACLREDFIGDGTQIEVEFNPLINDGDALRLAVRLNLHVCIEAEGAGVIKIEWDFDEGGFARQSIEEMAPVGGDDYTATRRAIVRAAAEIGKSTERKQ